MNKSLDMLSDAAGKLGRERGKQRAAIVLEKMTTQLAGRIIAGYESKDSQIMELCPQPMSGGLADDPTDIIDQIANLAEAYNLVVADDMEQSIENAENIIDLYERAFTQGFWDAVILSATTIMQGAA